MTTTPPGWYDDGHGVQRWWDGNGWTQHVHAPAAPAQVEADATQIFEPGGAPLPEAPKSRLWILWVVLGVVVVGLIVAAAVLIPLVIGLVTRGLTTPAVTGSTADERAAIAVVEQYDQAGATGDCEAFLSSTTEGFRIASEIVDCATFDEAVGYFDASTDDYVLTITGVESSADDIVVQTREEYTLLIDAGTPLDEPQTAYSEYSYTLVEQDGEWFIDDLTG